MLKKSTLVLVLLGLCFSTFGQRKLGGNVRISEEDRKLFGTDSLSNNRTKVLLSGKTKFTDYKIFSFFQDTSFVDTTLTIQKFYKLNYLRKDNFELLQFHNQGQTYNTLAYKFDNLSLLPDIGFLAKQFAYMDVEDIPYYEVPTPTTQISYKTGLQQGQFVDLIFTTNFSRRFNVSMSYKGIRSLGAYRRSLVSSGNFRTTFQYRSKKNQYEIRGHIATQDFFHEESGGLTDAAMTNFQTNDKNFSIRSRLDVNLIDAENTFNSRRLYVEQSYKLLAKKDSATQNDFSNLKIGHVFRSETKDYRFDQGSATTTIFGSVHPTTAENSVAEQKILDNQFNLEFNSKYVLGKFKVKANLTSVNYGYDTILNTSSAITASRIKADAFSFGADWNARIKNFKFNADARITPGNNVLSGSFVKGEAIFDKDSLFTLKGSVLLSSKSPNFNMLLHQSRYDDYNWSNNFSRVNTRDLGFAINSKWLNASLNFTNIDNYTYFDDNHLPQQYGSQITYIKVQANREFRYGKFALDNTLLYQNVTGGSDVFRVPEFITRNTLYYTDYWFRNKPLLAQIGLQLKYFSKFRMNAYNPLLAEFTLQNTEEIGFPTVNFFFNAQIRRTRIFFIADNILSSVGDRNYFSAPNYPFRDFTFRFGVVWNWFI